MEAAAEENRFDFVNDILVRYKNVKKIYGYKINSYWNNIADIDAYFKTNMDFLRPDVRSYFFKGGADHLLKGGRPATGQV